MQKNIFGITLKSSKFWTFLDYQKEHYQNVFKPFMVRCSIDTNLATANTNMKNNLSFKKNKNKKYLQKYYKPQFRPVNDCSFRFSELLSAHVPSVSHLRISEQFSYRKRAYNKSMIKYQRCSFSFRFSYQIYRKRILEFSYHPDSVAVVSV